jgi:hypothetical protein
VTRPKAAVAVASVAILATLVTGCSRNHSAAAPSTTGNVAVSTPASSAPAAAVSSAMPNAQANVAATSATVTPATVTPTTAAKTTGATPAPAGAAEAANAAGLAAVNSDLAGIDSGTAATDKLKTGARRAGAHNLHGVRDVDEASLGSDLLGPTFDSSAGNLNRPAAHAAQQMVMVAGTAASAVKGLAFGRSHRVDKPGVSECAQLVVHRRQPDLLAPPTQRLVQLLRAAELLSIVDDHSKGALLSG